MELLSPEFRQRLKKLRLMCDRVKSARSRGQRLSRALGHGIEFAGHRPYSHGDDTRYLDWNAAARLDQLVLKQFDAAGELTLVLAPDLSPSMAFGTPDKFSHALGVLAALGSIALHGSDRVLLAPVTGETQRPRVFHGVASEGALLEALSSLKPARTGISSAGGWLAGLRAMRGDSLLVLSSDFLARDTLLGAIRDLRRMNTRVLAFHHIAPQEFNPRLDGRVRLDFLERDGSRVKVNVTPAMLDEYRRELARWRAALAAACRRLGAVHFEAGTLEPMEELVAELVGRGLVHMGR